MKQESKTFSDKFVVQEMTNPMSWRLLKRENNSDLEKEEAVFSIQGIVMSKDLPPIYDKPRLAQQYESPASEDRNDTLTQNTPTPFQVPPPEHIANRTRFGYIFKCIECGTGDTRTF